ncbi:LuxR C-terminal-related transcriptional regulator [Thiotrichales bacterium 19X7-9]|nr:LuxR C-terminal-related transcriptional regulator [Thiotrichales bacterium 19X7-9]
MDILRINAGEERVIKCLIQGMSNHQIAKHLGYNERSIRRLVSNVKLTLNAENLVQLGYLWARYQVQMGIN